MSDGDSAYVYTSQGGAEDLYQVGDLTFQGTIDFVRVKAFGRVSSGTCTGSIAVAYCVSLLINLGQTVWSGNAQTFGSAYTEVSFTWSVHPGTGKPWTVSDVNALQVGVYKRTARRACALPQCGSRCKSLRRARR